VGAGFLNNPAEFLGECWPQSALILVAVWACMRDGDIRAELAQNAGVDL